MDFDFSRQSFPVKRRSNEDLWKLGGPATFDLNKDVLLNDVGHLLLLLFALVDFLLQICNLLRQGIKAVIVDGAVGY